MWGLPPLPQFLIHFEVCGFLRRPRSPHPQLIVGAYESCDVQVLNLLDETGRDFTNREGVKDGICKTEHKVVRYCKRCGRGTGFRGSSGMPNKRWKSH